MAEMRGSLLGLMLVLGLGAAAGCVGGGDAMPTPTPTPTPTPNTFSAGALPALTAMGCTNSACHGGSSLADTGGLYLSGSRDEVWAALTRDPGQDGQIVVDTSSPSASELLLKPDIDDPGLSHTGGKVWSPTEVHYRTVLAWIEAGALNN